MPVKQPVEKAQEPAVKERPAKASAGVSIIEILSGEAEKFVELKNYQDALFIYNQAFSIAGEDEKVKIISDIEKVLLKTPASKIQEFGKIKNIQIPQPLLLYWAGLNYALEDKNLLAGEMLETLLFRYPDHPYSADAKELLEVVKKSLFHGDTIGCLLPLTGKYAIFGQRALSGIQLAIQELSKRYQREFKVIIVDTKADPDTAVEGVRQLHQKNVAAIIGPLLTVNPAGLEAQRLQVPMIAMTQKSEFPLHGDYLFANFITPEMQVQTLGSFLFKKLGIKKVAILYPDEKYGKKYMKLFWDMVDEYDGEVVGVEAYDGKKTDFARPIQKLTGQFFPVPEFLKKKPGFENYSVLFEEKTDDLILPELEPKALGKNEKDDKIQIDFEALFIPDSPSTVNMILPQLAFNDARGMYLVGTNLWHHKSLLKEAKGYNKKAIITDGFFDDSQNPVTARFTKNFESMFNTKPGFLEAVSYDTASILFLTAMDNTVNSREMLKDSLQGRRLFEGATGNTIFDKNGTAHRELFLMTIKRGKFVELSR